MNYKNTVLTILENNCGDDGERFRDWVAENHPEIEIDYKHSCGGLGGGLADENGDEVESTLWDDFCNA